VTTGVLLPRVRLALADRYTIERELGRGGMSVVYLAHDEKLQRKAAVKVLHPEIAGLIGVERFEREIAICARLSHPHILPLYDSGEADGLLYYVMPFVDGESLRERLERDGPMPATGVAALVREVASALAAAHAEGIVHRDIKPANILLTRGQTFVSDFGIARSLPESGGSQRITGAGVTVGTPAYISPEQALGEGETDARADQYSLACVAYEMLTGEPPFASRSARTIAARHVFDVVPPIRTVRPGVSRTTEAVILRALAKAPADRWPDIESFANALHSSVNEPDSALGPRPRPHRRTAVVAVVVVAVAIAGIVAATMAHEGGGFGRATPTIDAARAAVLPFDITTTDRQLGITAEEMAAIVEARLGGTDVLALVPTSSTVAELRAIRPTGPISSQQRDQIARRVGAGQIVTGRVTVVGDSVVIGGTLHSLANRGREIRVEGITGPVGRLAALLEVVANELLVRAAGEPPSRFSTLVTRAPEPFKAYLSGRAKIARGRYRDASADFRRAIAADSTFATAGLALLFAQNLAGNSAGTIEGWQIAHRFRDRLTAPDQTLLAAVEAPAENNYSGLLRAWSRLTDSVSGLWETDYQFGELLYLWGPAIGNFDAHTQAANLFRQVLARDSAFAPALERLIDIAASAGDTTELRRLGRLHMACNPQADETDYIRWRLAGLLADSTQSDSGFRFDDSTSTQALSRVVVVAQLDAIRLADAVAAAREVQHRATTQLARWGAAELARALALNRGRPNDAPPTPSGPTYNGPVPELYRTIEALYWDGDSVEAAILVAKRARYADGPIPMSADPKEPVFMDVCLVGLWRASRNEWGFVRRAVERLGRARSAQLTPSSNYIPICRAILGARELAARNDPAAGVALERLDSIATARPATNAHIMFAANIMAARLHEAAGDNAAALEAVRRRTRSLDLGAAVGLSTLLREEGNLAATVGDTRGAIRAYSAYLTLRADAAPAFADDVADVRRRLMALVPDRSR